ncbi:N-acetylserotonin O-methyltransferase-like protein [Eumeta japonica]|uniref:N-acetylserotonin O-methyltransferase-like protein n=1 Tax=Eumeta variegata TaxID=151549 RepID=A0A4C1ZKG8_EUMVA|nr:N-acetylserotonin O-methyltransferase-like protein [Eumeta japonica]
MTHTPLPDARPLVVSLASAERPLPWAYKPRLNRDSVFKRTRLDNTYMSMRPIRAGVPQGSTLSPLLYFAYVNDIPRPSSCVQVALFVDDIALYLRSNSIGNILPRLLRAIDELTQWLRLWRIHVNPDKPVMAYPSPVFAHLRPDRQYDLQIVQNKFCRRAADAPRHPNPLIVSAVSYEPPPPHHFCRRPRNVLIDPPDHLTVEGLKVVLCPSTFEENLDPKNFSCFSDFVEETALQKVLEVENRLRLKEQPVDVIIGADTMVTLDGNLFGKPVTESEAFDMLSKLSGRKHTVYTGVVVKVGGVIQKFTEKSDVFFGKLDEEQIRGYIATGESMDKAGGYGIQGVGGTFVERVEGDYFTVVGLPLYRLCSVNSQKSVIDACLQHAAYNPPLTFESASTLRLKTTEKCLTNTPYALMDVTVYIFLRMCPVATKRLAD